MLCGESHTARPARMKRPGKHLRFGGNIRAGRLSSRFASAGLPKHWSSRMDAEALSRMHDELEVMRVLDEIGISWGI